MRSKWKGLFLHTILYKFANTKYKNFGPSWLNQKINIRASTYIKKFVSRSLMIHNGVALVNFKTYKQNYVGIKIGQLVFTRMPPVHSLVNPNRMNFRYKMTRQRYKFKSRMRSKLEFKSLKNIEE